MVVGKDGKELEHESIFGDVIMSKKYDPPRLRKVNLGYLATIYERLEQYDKALEYLLQFKQFFDKDVFKNMTIVDS